MENEEILSIVTLQRKTLLSLESRQKVGSRPRRFHSLEIGRSMRMATMVKIQGLKGMPILLPFLERMHLLLLCCLILF